MNNTFQVHFFCRNQWKSFLQIKTHLVTKTALGARSGSVGFVYAIF